jgi:hypothetical protein
MKRQKFGLKTVIFIFLLSSLIIIITTPIHEAVHWVISDIDPNIEPVEFNLFDIYSLQNNKNVLSSFLGYVVVEEAYPGAFNDRPIWADLLQELICISIQLILTCLIVLKILTIPSKKLQI